MKFKKLLALIAILSVLVIAAVVKKTAVHKEEAGEKAVTSQENAKLSQEFAAGFVTKIDLHRGTGDEEKLIFVKDDAGAWSLENHYGTPVRKETVDSLLRDLGSIRGEERAESEEVLEDFSLTDEKAFHFLLYGTDGKEQAHILLSPLRPRGTQNFVRSAGSNKVLATGTDILGSISIFSKEDKVVYRNFADLRVTGTDSSKVQSWTLTQEGAKPLTFVKKEENGNVTWSLAEDAAAKVDTAPVNELLSSLTNLYANDSVDPKANEATFAGKPAWLRLDLKAGEKPAFVELRVGPVFGENKSRLVQVMPAAHVFEVSDGQLAVWLNKVKDSFLVKAAPAPAAK